MAVGVVLLASRLDSGAGPTTEPSSVDSIHAAAPTFVAGVGLDDDAVELFGTDGSLRRFDRDDGVVVVGYEQGAEMIDTDT